jgi:formylglycine-generating enzyme
MTRRALIAAAVVAAIAALALLWAGGVRSPRVQCGPGFVPSGARCVFPAGACPAPLERGARGCDAPRTRVVVPARDVVIGPSDWEAEGRVPPRVVRVPPFAVDAFEVTVGAFEPSATADLARAASDMTPDDAARFCAARGGRLPTRDEWIAAAGARRYPWGDTGAVCRRAAWGLAGGPCAFGATGPDTVGAHPEGDSPEGIHDLAGNVAEWVTVPPASPETSPLSASAVAVRGGSWRSALATDLRTWAEEPPPVSPAPSANAPAMRAAHAAHATHATHATHVGFRCAYDLP